MTPRDNAAQDLAWVQQVQRHADRHAFAQLIRRHQGPLRALLRRLCGGQAALADELAQEACLRAWQALPGFRGDAQVRTWLYRIAYNEFLQHRRRAESQLQASSEPWADADEATDSGAAPLAQNVALSVALSLDVQQALNQLSPAERDAVVCCCMAEFSHSEAAEVLGWPLGTVKTHVLRGRAKLQSALAAWAPTPSGEAT